MMSTTYITTFESHPIPCGCWGWVMVHHGLDPPPGGMKQVSQVVGRGRRKILIQGNTL